MNSFTNRPKFVDGKFLRYVHQNWTVDHYGTKIEIKVNGHVFLSKVAGKDEKTGDMLFDEIEVPASLIFKVANLLRDSRKEVWMTPEEVAAAGLQVEESVG